MTSGQRFHTRLALAIALLTASISTVAANVGANGPVPTIVPVTPARLLDTRIGESTFDREFQATGTVDAGSVTSLKVAGRGKVAVDATAVVLNVTVVDPTAAGYVTVFPCGQDRPVASNLNYLADDVIPNAVITGIGTGGNVCLFSYASTDLIVDVTGYVPFGAAVETIAPARLLETRDGPGSTTADGEYQGGGPVAAGTIVQLTVAGRGGVAADAATAFLNVTAVAPRAAGFLTVYPCGDDRPDASNVNYAMGQTVPNAVTTQIGADGQVCIFTLATTDLLVDVAGFTAAASSFETVSPARLVNTRSGETEHTIDGQYLGIGPSTYSGISRVQIAGRGPVPAAAEYATLNVTVVDPTDHGFVTVYPCDANRPRTSNVNYAPGDVRANAVLAKLDPDGAVCIFSLAPTHIVVDVGGFGAFTPTSTELLRMALGASTAASSGSPTIGVFVCDVPLDTTRWPDAERLALTPSELAEGATTYIAPYFDTLSAGRYTPSFVAASVITLGPDDGRDECLDAAIDRGNAYNLVIAVDNVDRDWNGAIGIARQARYDDFERPLGIWIAGLSIRLGLWDTWSHEVGHTVFWNHAQSNDGFAYGDRFDVMGWGLGCTGDAVIDTICPAGQQTQAMNRYIAGWIDDSRVAQHIDGTATYTLGPLGSGNLELILATDVTQTAAITIEARVQRGYDINLPSEGVVVRFARAMDTRIAVADDQGDDVTLAPGDTRTIAGLTITVTERIGDTFSVSLTGAYDGSSALARRAPNTSNSRPADPYRRLNR